MFRLALEQNLPVVNAILNAGEWHSPLNFTFLILSGNEQVQTLSAKLCSIPGSPSRPATPPCTLCMGAMYGPENIPEEIIVCGKIVEIIYCWFRSKKKMNKELHALNGNTTLQDEKNSEKTVEPVPEEKLIVPHWPIIPTSSAPVHVISLGAKKRNSRHSYFQIVKNLQRKCVRNEHFQRRQMLIQNGIFMT